MKKRNRPPVPLPPKNRADRSPETKNVSRKRPQTPPKKYTLATQSSETKKRPRFPSDETEIPKKKEKARTMIDLTVEKDEKKTGADFDLDGFAITGVRRPNKSTGSGKSIMDEDDLKNYINENFDFLFIETPKDGTCLFSAFSKFFMFNDKLQDELSKLRKKAESFFVEGLVEISDKDARIDGLTFRLLVQKRIKEEDSYQIKILNLTTNKTELNILTNLIGNEFKNITKEKIRESKNCTAAWTSIHIVWIIMILFPEVKSVYELQTYQGEFAGGNYWKKFYIDQKGRGQEQIMERDVEVDSENAIFIVFFRNHFSLLFPKTEGKVKLKLLPGPTNIDLAKQVFIKQALKLLKL